MTTRSRFLAMERVYGLGRRAGTAPQRWTWCKFEACVRRADKLRPHNRAEVVVLVLIVTFA
jgi:hypothetical protein